MSRYRVASGSEGELEPDADAGVLRNRLHLKTVKEIDQAEFDLLLQAQRSWWSKVTLDMPFTAALICEMHRDWLGTMYEWAGHYRTVEMEKGGFRWPPAYLVEDNMARLESRLLCRLTPARQKLTNDTCLDAATIHAELLLVHPFRDGNGRLARWLTDLHFLQAGLSPLDHGFVGPGSVGRRTRYLEAVKRGYVGDLAPLAEVFAEALERSERGRKPLAPSKTEEP